MLFTGAGCRSLKFHGRDRAIAAEVKLAARPFLQDQSLHMAEAGEAEIAEHAKTQQGSRAGGKTTQKREGFEGVSAEKNSRLTGGSTGIDAQIPMSARNGLPGPRRCS